MKVLSCLDYSKHTLSRLLLPCMFMPVHRRMQYDFWNMFFFVLLRSCSIIVSRPMLPTPRCLQSQFSSASVVLFDVGKSVLPQVEGVEGALHVGLGDKGNFLLQHR